MDQFTLPTTHYTLCKVDIFCIAKTEKKREKRYSNQLCVCRVKSHAIHFHHLLYFHISINISFFGSNNDIPSHIIYVFKSKFDFHFMQINYVCDTLWYTLRLTVISIWLISFCYWNWKLSRKKKLKTKKKTFFFALWKWCNNFQFFICSWVWNYSFLPIVRIAKQTKIEKSKRKNLFIQFQLIISIISLNFDIHYTTPYYYSISGFQVSVKRVKPKKLHFPLAKSKNQNKSKENHDAESFNKQHLKYYPFNRNKFFFSCI